MIFWWPAIDDETSSINSGIVNLVLICIFVAAFVGTLIYLLWDPHGDSPSPARRFFSAYFCWHLV